jgi:hypothetical protein
MPDPIEDYRQARDNYKRLQAEAKKALLARHQELSSELLQIQKELREEFNLKVTFPGKAKAGVKKKTPAPSAAPQPSKPDDNPKIASLQKRLAVQKKKLDEVVKAGKDPKPIKDRIYELEDELKLATTA